MAGVVGQLKYDEYRDQPECMHEGRMGVWHLPGASERMFSRCVKGVDMCPRMES